MLNPPVDFLDFIKKPEENCVFFGGVFPTFSLKLDEVGNWERLLVFLPDLVQRFFRRKIYKKQFPPVRNLVGEIFWEALINAIEHGNKGDKSKLITFGLWLGSQGVMFGVRDEGNFFQDETNIELVQSRICLPSTKEEPSGIGLDTIYQAQYIRVKDSTFYLVITFEQMKTVAQQ